MKMQVQLKNLIANHGHVQTLFMKNSFYKKSFKEGCGVSSSHKRVRDVNEHSEDNGNISI